MTQFTLRSYTTFGFIAPVLMLILFITLIGPLNNMSISRASYWLIQKDIFLTLNHLFSTLPDWFWLNATQLGDTLVLIPLLALLFFYNRQIWMAIIYASPIAGLFSEVCKKLIATPRPALTLDHNSFFILGDIVKGHTSCPSGHTITVFTAAIAILFSLSSNPNQLKHYFVIIAILLVATIVAFSRVAVGAHWPLDLLAGAALGWIAGLTGALLARRKTYLWPQTLKAHIIISLAFIANAIFLINKANYLISWASAIASLIVVALLIKQYRKLAIQHA